MSFTVAIGDRVEGNYANPAQYRESFAGAVVLVEPTHFVVDDQGDLVTCFLSNVDFYDPDEPDTATFDDGGGAFDVTVIERQPALLIAEPFVEVLVDRSPRGRLSPLAERLI